MTAILGISAFYHDSASALIIDGEMSKMLETQKHVQAYLAQKKYNEEYTKLIQKERELIDKIKTEIRNELVKLGNYKKTAQKERIIFKYPCPMEDCRGFVSVKGNCGTCECKVCTTCNQVKQVDHECNPDDIASFELIKTTNWKFKAKLTLIGC